MPRKPMHHLVLMPARLKLDAAYDHGAARGTDLLVTLLPQLAVTPLLFA
jgi:hypothetical protein